MLTFAFNPFITIPHLVIEFLSSFCLRPININDQNPYYSIRFKLGGRVHFITKEEFDNVFGFKSEGEIGPNTLWSPSSFWATNVKPNALPF